MIVSAEADSVFQRVVAVPFSDKAKAREIAPLMAEESLPLALEKLTIHTHVLEKTAEGARVFVAASPVERTARRIALLHEAGLEPKAVEAELSALAAVASLALASTVGVCAVELDGNSCKGVYIGPHGPEKYFALSAAADSPELPGELSLRLTAQKDSGSPLRAVYLSGPDAAGADLHAWREALGMVVELMPAPKKLGRMPEGDFPAWPAWAIPLGLALGETHANGAAPHVNLLTGQFGGEEEINWRNRLTTAGVAVAVLVALWAASVGIEAAYKKKQLDSINDSIRKLFTANLPGVKNIVDEVAQLKQRAVEQEERARTLGGLLRKEVDPLRILKEMSERIPPDIKVEFREFVAEPERVRIYGETASFDALDKIKTKLSEYPWFSSVVVSDAKASVDQTKVIFRLTITLGQKEAAQ